jgi:hypothetical protein
VRRIHSLAHGHERRNAHTAHASDAHIVDGCRTGCIGDAASLDARFYAHHAVFGVFFERKVATELGAFAEGLPAPAGRYGS